MKQSLSEKNLEKVLDFLLNICIIKHKLTNCEFAYNLSHKLRAYLCQKIPAVEGFFDDPILP